VPGSLKVRFNVFCGIFALLIVIQISKLVLVLNENSWNIEIPFHPCCLRLGAKPTARWLSSLDPVRFTVVKRDDTSTVL
jgi:hypothetical protein